MSAVATPRGCSAYACRFTDRVFQELGCTGLNVSQAGFGTYRTDWQIPEHVLSLREALQNGVNLIDTSANYVDGAAEEMIGEVLGEGVIGREEVVVVSKVGYIQGRNLEVALERQRTGRPFPEIVHFGPGIYHCIHPEFIDDQLTRSLDRLKLSCIDVYLLHNPEYFLGLSQRHGIPLDEARVEYYRRIEKAFEHLEKEVQRGRIQFYGISSNRFPVDESEYEFTCLRHVLDIAKSITENHHFQVVQMPINILESGAVLSAQQSNDDMPVVDFALKNRLAVLANRPLNAIWKGRLIRLSNQVNEPFFDEIEALVKDADLDWGGTNTLSQLAVRCLRSTSGITCTLVGMRRRSYVEDITLELKVPVPVKNRFHSWMRLRNIIKLLK